MINQEIGPKAGKEYSLDDLIGTLGGKEHGIWVVEDHKRILGVMIWYKKLNGEGYFWLGAIRKEYKSKGIGRTLFRYLIEDAAKYCQKARILIMEGDKKMEKLLQPYNAQTIDWKVSGDKTILEKDIDLTPKLPNPMKHTRSVVLDLAEVEEF